MKKKLLALLLSSAMVMSLAACGGGGASSGGTPATSKPANSGAPAAPDASALQVTLVVADTFGALLLRLLQGGRGQTGGG